MKKYSLFLFIILLSLNCSTDERIRKRNKKKPASGTKKEFQIIKGKLEIYSEKEMYIVKNWKTRSRVSYQIENINEFPELKSLKDKILTVKVKILEQKSPWSGKIKLKEIIKIEEDNE